MTALAIAHDATPITFPMPAPLMNMNKRLHWREERRLARIWRATACIAAVESLGTPKQRRRGPSMVKITLPVRTNARRDPHNYFPTVKHIVDGLVDAGIWPDDNPEWVTTVEPRLERGTRGLVIVLLTPRPAR